MVRLPVDLRPHLLRHPLHLRQPRVEGRPQRDDVLDGALHHEARREVGLRRVRLQVPEVRHRFALRQRRHRLLCGAALPHPGQDQRADVVGVLLHGHADLRGVLGVHRRVQHGARLLFGGLHGDRRRHRMPLHRGHGVAHGPALRHDADHPLRRRGHGLRALHGRRGELLRARPRARLHLQLLPLRQGDVAAEVDDGGEQGEVRPLHVADVGLRALRRHDARGLRHLRGARALQEHG
mmetsp:Transcript_30171/g.86125  ORF Transcript_30171/g.86125 Transcript_30171/m.86125 type:complete len:237 (-) Transcript_30171:308-1018(-)